MGGDEELILIIRPNVYLLHPKIGISLYIRPNLIRTPLETYRGTVYPWHCDFIGHMNVMHYVGKFDQATWNFLMQIGITPTYLQNENKGMVAVEQNLKYFAELVAGNCIYIKTELIEAKSKAIIFHHKMYNAETHELCAEGRMVGVHIDKKTRKSENLPEFILEKIKSLSTV